MYDNTLNAILDAMLALDAALHEKPLPTATKEKVWEAMKRIMDVRDALIEVNNANSAVFEDQSSVLPGVH